MTTQPLHAAERASFERWYACNAFDYERNPIGSRECGLQWSAWLARAQQMPASPDLPPLPEISNEAVIAAASAADMAVYDRLAAAGQVREPLTDIEAAAKKLAEVFDYPWGPMPEKGREAMRANARAVLLAAAPRPQEQVEGGA